MPAGMSHILTRLTGLRGLRGVRPRAADREPRDGVPAGPVSRPARVPAPPGRRSCRCRIRRYRNPPCRIHRCRIRPCRTRPCRTRRCRTRPCRTRRCRAGAATAGFCGADAGLESAGAESARAESARAESARAAAAGVAGVAVRGADAAEVPGTESAGLEAPRVKPAGVAAAAVCGPDAAERARVGGAGAEPARVAAPDVARRVLGRVHGRLAAAPGGQPATGPGRTRRTGIAGPGWVRALAAGRASQPAGRHRAGLAGLPRRAGRRRVRGVEWAHVSRGRPGLPGRCRVPPGRAGGPAGWSTRRPARRRPARPRSGWRWRRPPGR